jgi:hypothetical protein
MSPVTERVSVGVHVKETTMSTDQDVSGDYGYDLAHEMKIALGTPMTTRRRRTVSVPAQILRRELDPDADFGYDSAHEI